MRKNLFYFLTKKGRTFPLVKISFFWKILIHWVHSILCSYVAFSSIVLFDMLLRSNDFEWFVVSEYCKYHIAYLMWNSSHCYELWLWVTFLEVVLTKNWIFSFSMSLLMLMKMPTLSNRFIWLKHLKVLVSCLLYPSWVRLVTFQHFQNQNNFSLISVLIRQ